MKQKVESTNITDNLIETQVDRLLLTRMITVVLRNRSRQVNQFPSLVGYLFHYYCIFISYLL